MKSSLRRACLLAACLAMSLPAVAGDNPSSTPTEHFIRALQEQRFDEAAAMFKPRGQQTPAATAAQLKRIANRLGGLASLGNVPSLPSGKTLKLRVPSASPTVGLVSFQQVIYKATAADGQPVFYALALDPAPAPQRILWLDVYLPMPDAASAKRAGQALRDLI